MKSKILSSLLLFFGLAGALLFPAAAARAQEGEPVVVDEVIAQVDDGVVTLSQLKREMKERVEILKQRGMTDAQAAAEVEKHRAELIAALINEQLLLQRGKQLDLTERVEAEVNRRMLDVARENGVNSIEKLNQAMTEAGFDPVATRQTMRVEIMKQAVLESEVDSKIFWGWTAEQLRTYFNQHPDKFRKPETVELSEIFLSLAGKPEAEVKAKADQLVAQARAGADFGALAAASSDRQPEQKGKVGLFELGNLRPDIVAAIKNVKAGGITDPMRSDEGFQILRVDQRTAGNDAPVFNENRVREIMTAERTPKEREDYLQNLRNDAYVKVSESYRASVEPLLNIVPPAAATKRPSKKDKKEKNDKQP